MKLMTKEIEKRLERHPFYSSGSKGMESEVIVKFFAPIGAATWLITEGQRQDNGDWLLYGYCCLHYGEWEWGYVLLSELESIVLRPFGIGIERDRYILKGSVVRDCIR